MVLRQVVVDDAAQPMVGQRLFVKGHAHTPHHASQDLAGCSLWVDHPSCRHCADHPGHPDGAKVLVNVDFHEHRRMSGGGEQLAPGAWLGIDLHFETSTRGAGHDVPQGKAKAAGVQVAISKNDLLRGGIGELWVCVARVFQHFAA
ncbi:hypothetical protein D3C81_1376960 [compost metagenome]